MGFEQLASLRDELAQKAKAEKSVKRAEKKPNKEAKIDPNLRVIGLLQKHFPQAFPKSPKPKVPLKIGIHKDLHEHLARLNISEKELRQAIKTWCWGNRYWSCLQDQAARVGLNGEEAGIVDKNDAERAIRLKEARQRKSKPSSAAGDQVSSEPSADDA